MTDDNWAAPFDDTFDAPAPAVQAAVWQRVFTEWYVPSRDAHSPSRSSD